MKKLTMCVLVLLCVISITIGQAPSTPHAMVYQAIAKDPTGQALVSQALKLKVAFRQTGVSGPIVYEEEHSVTTSLTGFLSVYLGAGLPITGTYTSIQWGSSMYYVETSIDVTGAGSNYFTLGASPIVAIPLAEYAFKADTAQYVANPVYQTLTLSNDMLTLSDGGTVDLSGYQNTDAQQLTLNTNTLSLTNGGTVDLSAFVNTDAQTLSLVNNTLSITGGNSVSLGGLSASYLADANNNTKIQVEETTDDDIIRFDINGSEELQFYTNAGGVTLMNYTSNSGNVVIGNNTGLNMTTSGTDNIMIGESAGRNNTSGDYNLFIGEDAGRSNTTGYENVFLGRGTGYANTSGLDNVFIGSRAGNFSITGGDNTYIGDDSGRRNSSGHSNTFIGAEACENNLTGIYNTVVGATAGYNATGSYNVFIGKGAGYNETSNNKLYIENSTSITALIYGDFADNEVIINGNSSNNSSNYTFFVNGAAGGTTQWNSFSDKRLKTNVKAITNPLQKVLQLRGVNYNWKDGRESGLQIGFIAQEAEKVLPEVVNTTGEYYSMQYAPITALLVEAMKEQQGQIEDLQKENELLKVQVAKIEQLEQQVVQLLKAQNEQTMNTISK